MSIAIEKRYSIESITSIPIVMVSLAVITSDLHSVPQLVGIIHRSGHQEAQHHVLKVPRQLSLQIIGQVLQGQRHRHLKWALTDTISCLVLK